MGLSGLLAAIAGEYTQRYIDRVNKFTSNHNQTKTSNLPTVPSPTAVPIDSPEKTDCYEPSGIQPLENNTAKKKTETPAEKTDTPTVKTKPDGTYYYKRSANLDYQLDLRFNLSTLTQTVQYLADGETEAVEMFAAAGFGLSADFNLSGSQTIETNMVEYTDGQNAHLKENTMAKSRQIGKFKAQNDNFKVSSFMRQAADINRSLDVKVRDNHYKAVNKIAYRYQVDNRFSFSFAERFNINTEQMAGASIDTQNSYFNTAGNLADSSTTEMMATFFDAVESYLAETEAAFTANTESFFQSAAAELGFNGELVDYTSEQLTGTIENFFNRVESAVAQLESLYVPNAEIPAAESTPAAPEFYNVPPVNEPVQLAEI